MGRHFDAAKFIQQEFGGVSGFHERLSRAKVPGLPKEACVYRYFKRSSMPGPLLAAALLIRERDTGSPVSLEAYCRLKGETSCQTKLRTEKPVFTGPAASVFD